LGSSHLPHFHPLHSACVQVNWVVWPALSAINLSVVSAGFMYNTVHLRCVTAAAGGCMLHSPDRGLLGLRLRAPQFPPPLKPAGVCIPLACRSRFNTVFCSSTSAHSAGAPTSRMWRMPNLRRCRMRRPGQRTPRHQRAAPRWARRIA